MSVKLKPYPRYKDSGLAWLGEIPAHWKIERLKRLVENIVDQKSGKDTDEIYVALEQVESWTGRIRPARDGIEFESMVKRFRPNDVLFGKLRPYLAKVARPSQGGVCVGEFFVLRPAPEAMRPAFVEQIVRSAPFIDLVNSSTFGAKMPRADWSFVGSIEVAHPPLPEQEAIARFLDYTDRLIGRFIRAKRRLIELLNEQKQAIIQQAVTRGLDPDVRLKPSGVEWLGEVPEHWEIKRIKHLVRLSSGDSITALDINDSGPYTVYGGNGVRGFTSAYTHDGQFVLIGRQGALCGNINYAKGQFWASEHAVVAVPLKVYNLLWFGELLRIMNLNQYSIAAAQPGLAVERIQNLRIPVPPVAEQISIANHIENETAALGNAIDHANCEIDLVREYRTRLIADVVTGKLDVRGVELSELDEADDQGLLEDIADEDGGELELMEEGADAGD